MQGVRHGHAVHPSTLHVYSPWVIQWLIPDADSPEGAVDAVQHDRLPRLLAALNSLPTGPYRVEVMRVGRVDTAGGLGDETTPWSTSVMQTFGPPTRALTADEGTALRSRTRLLQARPALWSIARHYQDGLLLLDLRGGLPATMTAAPFTSFHRFVEGVVQTRHRKPASTDDDIAARRAITDCLLAKLQNARRRNRHAAAVTEASRALAAIAEHGFPARLVTVVRDLGGTPDLARELRAFYDFRNRYFAHNGTTITDDLAHEWAERAAEACRELLDLWLVSEGAAPTPTTLVVPAELATGAQDYPVRIARIDLDPASGLPSDLA